MHRANRLAKQAASQRPPRVVAEPGPVAYVPRGIVGDFHAHGSAFFKISMNVGIMRGTGIEVLKLLYWLWRLGWRSCSFAWSWRGWLLRARDQRVKDRMATCLQCSGAKYVESGGRRKYYCRLCDCPRWWWSRLDNKNRIKRFNCPIGAHAGSVKRICFGCRR